VGLEAAEAELRQAEHDLAEMKGAKARFDALPSRKMFFDPSLENFKSIFAQTEDGVAAEEAERIDKTIETWRSKLVVDQKNLRLSMISRDRGPQSDRLRGMLHDTAAKTSLTALYKGKTPLTNGDCRPVEPSIFMHESTRDGIEAFESSLRPHDPTQWKGTKNFTAGSTLGISLRPKENLLKATWETKRSHAPLTALDRSGPLFTARERAAPSLAPGWSNSLASR